MRSRLLLATAAAAAVTSCSGTPAVSEPASPSLAMPAGDAPPSPSANLDPDHNKELPADNTVTKPVSPLEDLRPALLEASDLPDSWTEVPPSTDDDKPAGQCDTRIQPHRLESEFQATALGPFVTHSILLFDNSEEAEAAVASFISRLESCDGTTDANGTSYRFSRMALTTRHDQTDGLEFSAQDNELEASGALVLVRKGAVLSYVATVSADTDDKELTLQLVDRIETKLTQV